ncbi:hypothetical protein [Novosphingobium beihaiensis]|uniref:Uncharacterized protein n=1 Tax=Novosphingobium beihaiensis TaxID=2930389 RepID=A0ABT0BNS3_9SPHN|nr:hypothetical protein [Novosphingobium beihaiensis]MCJ2186694.1 hypothetical protein [Novosphingobium beihaiensis]
MYAFIDRRVDGLCDGGRFFVWAMRGWRQSLQKGVCPPRALSRGFAGVGGGAALPDFHIAMALLNRDAREEIVIGAMDCPHIVEGEAVLLGIWRDLALGDTGNARETLKLLASEDAAPPIARAMTTAAAKMIAAGFDLSELSTHVSEEVKPSDE